MPLCVIDCSQKVAENNDYSLKLNDIIEYEKTYCKIPTGAFVAMRSDWYKRWPNQKSFKTVMKWRKSLSWLVIRSCEIPCGGT